MRATYRFICSMSEWLGLAARWVSLALVLALFYEVVARYVFGAPTIWAHQLSTMLGCTLIVLGLAYVHRLDGHARVDVFYARVPEKARAAVNVLGGFIVFLPLMGFMLYRSFLEMCASWRGGEILTASTWYPPAGPIRTVVFVGVLVFFLQGMGNLLRDICRLLNKPID